MSKTEEVAALWSEVVWRIVQELKPPTPPPLRDQFAMAALTGAIASLDCDPLPGYQAKQAYEVADAMLEARKVEDDRPD
jgi:hypothetical protein